MATRNEYKAMGYSDEQINKALANAGMGFAPQNVAPANAPVSFTAQKEVIAGQNAPVSGMSANPVPGVPAPAQVTQNAADVAWNERQKAFDLANPAGTKIENVTNPTQAQVDAQKGSLTFSPTTQATQVPTTATKPAETPKTTPSATVSKPASKDQAYFDNSTGREQEIVDNLNKFRDSGVTDPDQIKKMAGYDTADARKKEIIDAFTAVAKPDENQIFGMLATNSAVPPALKQTAEYKNATARLADYRKFASFSPSQLASALGNTLIEGTKAYNDLYSTPEGKLKLDAAKKFTQTKGTDFVQAGTSVTEEIKANNPNIKSALDDGFISNDEWAAMMKTPEIDAKRSDVEKKKNKYEALKAQYDDMETSVDEEYAGKNLTAWLRASLIADRRKKMYKDLTVATSEYNNATGTLSDMLKEQGSLVDRNLALYKDQKDFEQAKSLALFQSNLAVEQAKQKQLIEQGDINSTDPFLRRQAIVNQVEQLKKQFPTAGMQRSTEQVVADVEKLIASGVPAGQALSENFVKPFIEKDEVKAAGTKYEKLGSSLYAIDAKGNMKKIAEDEEGRYLNSSLWVFDTKTGQYIGKTWTSTASSSVSSVWSKQNGAFNPDNFTETGFGGPYDNFKGYDLDVKTGDPISGFSGEVIEAYGDWKKQDALYKQAPNVAVKPTAYGNYVKIRLDDGKVIRLSHLDSVNVKPGQKIDFGTVFGLGGATGNVKAGPGGDGSHLDITIDGMDSKQVKQYLKGYGVSQAPQADYGTAISEASSILKASLPKTISEGLDENLARVKDKPKLARDVLQSYFLNGQPAEFQNKFKGREVAINSLRAIRDKLIEFDRRGGKTGFVEGNELKVNEAFGKTNNPELSALGTEIRTALQAYRSFISGAAFTESENRDYQAVFPGTDKDFSLNMAKIDGLLNSYGWINENFIRGWVGDTAYEAYFKDRYKDSGNLVENIKRGQWFYEQAKQERKKEVGSILDKLF